MGISALGLVATGLVELALALLTGSVALLADALHNLSDVSSSAIVFVGFRICKRPPTPASPTAPSAPKTSQGLRSPC
jgi:divalent metal cation (Fe/Co/Zn/Cd) transporter